MCKVELIYTVWFAELDPSLCGFSMDGQFFQLSFKVYNN